MKDMYGNKILNGDFLLDSNEESSYVFKVTDGKLVLVALWELCSITKFSIEDVKKANEFIKRNIRKGIAPAFLKGYYSKLIKRLENIDPESLVKVKGVNVEILNKFIDEGHESIGYHADNNEDGNPIAYFNNEEIVGTWQNK